MQQFLTFAIASAVLFTAGLLAGQNVNHADEVVSSPVISTPATVENDSISSDELAVDPLEKPMPSQVMNASHQRHEEVIDGYIFSSLDGTNDSTKALPSSIEETTEISNAPANVANPEAQAQLKSLISHMFPDASSETVAIWAESYEGMDLSEVQFILEQKRSLSSSLDSEIATAMLGTPLGTIPANSLLSQLPASPIVEAQNAVRMNLQGAWSSGYRRMVVIPEAVNNQSPAGIVSSVPRHVTMFRSFETGRLQPSPVPTHVAIGSKNGALMFCLEGNMFTRRGDFQRLEDGRLGLVTSSGSRALKDATAIPESTTKIEITPMGEILCHADGRPSCAGHVGIVELSEMNRLQTVDGVFFTSETPMESPVTALEADLTIHQLELSNVSRSDETQLLELLNTELP